MIKVLGYLVVGIGLIPVVASVLLVALGLSICVAWLESVAVLCIWKWKLQYAFPELAPYVSLANIFYANLAIAITRNRIRRTGENKEIDWSAIASYALSPLVLIAAVWLLIQAGF